MDRITKDAFCVIGKVGSTNDGEGFVKKLWEDANAHFNEVKQFAAKNEDGSLKGFWGAMTNFSFEFKPWENNFSEGLYLAGLEVNTNAVAPKGWKKWIIPGFEYIKVPVNGINTFSETLNYLRESNMTLAGAVQDFIDPKTGGNYMMFPIACNDSKRDLIKKIKKETNQFSYCGLHCEYCFLSEWCGGCKSACNMCSYASFTDNNICPNVSCCDEKGLDGCYACESLYECKKGFYAPDSHGANASKALAVIRRDFGNEAVIKALSALHRKYDFAELQKVLNEDLETAICQLKDLLK